MSRLVLDDEWGEDGLNAILIAKHKRLRLVYSIVFIILAPLWGGLLNYIEDYRLIDVDIATLFFTVSGLLLTIYGVLVFKKIGFMFLYIAITFVLALGAMAVLIQYFNLNQNTLPILCFLSGLIVVALAWVIPLQYKRP